MKKRMMLAVATFATGVATALITPNAHAGVADGTLNNPHALTGTELLNPPANSTADTPADGHQNSREG
ncbi:hypothetical protein [Streptomyces sp. SPB162]|uniref:hypothetical protein n=1 Tax=Streptomyces sp. SPB162 TaxID=2940560 RepID=UPI002406EF8E|nr:hypothetical protein [Streptomyces sp. SPB162]MDF9811476.1 hypothetical protein [Streptomyces sp. SPB162]